MRRARERTHIPEQSKLTRPHYINADTSAKIQLKGVRDNLMEVDTDTVRPCVETAHEESFTIFGTGQDNTEPRTVNMHPYVGVLLFH